MATMNKPASNSSDWYQAVTDNWGSIEKNLIDKSLVTAKGDIVTASAPGSPTRLGVGTNGQVLLLQSGTPAWGNYNFTDTQYMEQMVLDKRFFIAANLLPATQHYQTAADAAPAVDWDSTGVTSTTTGTSRRWEGVTGTQVFGWDLGAARRRILMILSGYQTCGGDRFPFVTDTKPASGDLTGNGYLCANSNANNGPYVWRVNSGALQALGGAKYMEYRNHPYGMAILFDSGIRMFFRFGNSQWIEGGYKVDSTYATLRYCGIRMASGGAQIIGPVGIYYDA